jgi:uncharacterized protein YdeI (YjbR/CyaY-like superfamily)
MSARVFRSSKSFRTWLAKEHGRTKVLMMRIYKKDSGVLSITYAEALDQALCFGWIDGQKLPLDEISWIQKFTKRRPKSNWSKKNTEHAARLIDSGEMAAAGLLEVEAAKKDGRWSAAYDSPSKAAPSKEFLAQLARNKKASAMYATLDKANLYAIHYRLQTAKREETRLERTKKIIEMLARGEKFH